MSSSPLIPVSSKGAPMTTTRLCARCRHVLVDEDDQGWYYQVAVTSVEIPCLVFMDRVHQCDGKPHLVIAPENTSPRCELCDREESHPFHAPDYEFSGRHAFKATAPEPSDRWTSLRDHIRQERATQDELAGDYAELGHDDKSERAYGRVEAYDEMLATMDRMEAGQ